MKSESGFTLVEVIVVSVIVAVLSLVAVFLYVGFVNEARLDMAENTAASAATYLNAAVNLDAVIPGPGISQELAGSGVWVSEVGGSDSALFRAPAGVIVTIDPGTKSVSAVYGEHNSSSHKYE